MSTKTKRCAIVLAAGEGQRLKPFISRLRGDALPKQFVNFIGRRSMLEHTFSRAEMLIPPERIVTVVGRHHLASSEVKRQLWSRCPRTVVLQPENRETGPGLLLPLMHIVKEHPDAVVAVFPSDHFVAEEALFMSHVDLALRIVERYPAFLVLLGMEPDMPEPEYGYILPDGSERVFAPLRVQKVSRFVEKPGPDMVHELLRKGALWNTMVMVFKADTMLELVRRTTPLLYAAFRQIESAIGTPGEAGTVAEIYRKLRVINFSRGILESSPREVAARLLVLPVRGVHWSDWGSEQRVIEVLSRMGYLDRLRAQSSRSATYDRAGELTKRTVAS